MFSQRYTGYRYEKDQYECEIYPLRILREKLSRLDFVQWKEQGAGPQRSIDESISLTAKGIVLDIERNTVNSIWSKDGSGNFVYFILVRYPEDKILEMHRLSRGAKLIAIDVPDPDADGINLKVSEVNGVSVTLTSADILIRQHNLFAKTISLFLWKVPAIVENRSSTPLDPVRLCGNSIKIPIPIDTFRKSLIDHLLGANFETIVTLKGFDGIGRPVSAKIEI
jgi:hypothetical protein